MGGRKKWEERGRKKGKRGGGGANREGEGVGERWDK